ncbi:hypothetical protein FHG87_010669 [Trinorchestia longiramus]|nr:hypothetical protein FHG87_010669 [Trinorchestia longiramus]
MRVRQRVSQRLPQNPHTLHTSHTPRLQEVRCSTQSKGERGGGSVSQSGPYRPPGGVDEMQGGGRRVRLEWGAYITV